jgi:hypothetical protein
VHNLARGDAAAPGFKVAAPVAPALNWQVSLSAREKADAVQPHSLRFDVILKN